MERRSIVVSGVVQGVGFRLFVDGLVSRLGRSGFIRNQSSGVVIEVEGQTPHADCFLAPVKLPFPGTLDFSLAATKYFDALAGGEIPLLFLFSGTIFFEGSDCSPRQMNR